MLDLFDSPLTAAQILEEMPDLEVIQLSPYEDLLTGPLTLMIR